ncbi:MAG TPA: methylated-DNA--[protein]-cysteine S-methyltransferase, partial [Verrucomicrobiae bacterium]|nr:methylated-DNA--[protein]-cysteine S-methyltransferase [Verrucomicrobiae bacterium]
MKNNLFELPISTRDGQFTARYSGKGLAEMDFPFRSAAVPAAGSRAVPVSDSWSGGKMPPSTAGVDARATTARTRAVKTNRVPAQIRIWHHVTETALKNVLAGRVVKNLPPLDLSDGTEFQRAVWRELRKLSPGQTKSYGEIAEAIGKARAVRAVGGACGANPIPVLVPCHRVLAAHGKIGGFGGGLDWKRKLL